MILALLWGLVGSGLPGVAPRAAAATVVAPGFQVSTVFAGLDFPSAIAFAPDGRIFVTETGGVIKAFDNLDDSTPTTVVDMSGKVHTVGDRGMLGLAVDPSFPTKPYLYVTYTVDAAPGGTPPEYNDTCPRDPVTRQADNCPATGRLVRIQVDAASRFVAEKILIGGVGDNFWCHHGRQHAIGHVAFGPDGALYVSSGEGSASLGTDYGQQNQGAINPCGDPPEPVGTSLTVPTTEGGALRSQDLRTPADPAQGSGAIIRVNPDTGAAMPGNPLIGNGVPTDDRHIAYGLRNPFRFTFRPGTSEIWVSDVGWNTWEEIDRIQNPTDATVENFGWPCYEGTARQPQWDALDVDMCESLYAAGPGAVTNPFWAYRHTAPPDPANCPNAGGAVSGVAFSQGAPYPASYNGALFVTDYVKGCIWAVLAGSNGLPNPANIQTVVSGVTPVELEIGPDGRLYYVDIGFGPGMGTIGRVDFFGGNMPPVARATASPSSGPAPLTVNFSAAASTDDQPTSQLTYAWDLDADGAYDDATGVTTSRTYGTPGNVRVGLRVTDAAGLFGSTTVSIAAGNSPPAATILTPTATSSWASGDDIGFSGSGSDPQDGTLGASAMRWSVTLFHCQTATDCHAHPQADRPGISEGTFGAPEHEYPAYLEFRLTVTDSGGLSDTETVRVDPRTANLTFQTNPSGLELLADTAQGPAPLTVTSIVGSPVSVTAPTTQTVGGVTYDFTSWSDGGAPSHDVMPGTTSATYTATYTPRPVGGTVLPFSDIAGSAFIADIAWVAEQGITLGCGNGQYCPKDNVTRAQMASFISRALSLPAATTDYFPDDAGSIHEADINRLAAAGISNGCGGGLYCPGAAVTRAQMASFLSRALSLAAAGQDYFSDDAGSFHEADINRLAAAGVTNGCGGGLYCPDQPVTREQMAAFLHRAIGD